MPSIYNHINKNLDVYKMKTPKEVIPFIIIWLIDRGCSVNYEDKIYIEKELYKKYS